MKQPRMKIGFGNFRGDAIASLLRERRVFGEGLGKPLPVKCELQRNISAGSLQMERHRDPRSADCLRIRGPVDNGQTTDGTKRAGLSAVANKPVRIAIVELDLWFDNFLDIFGKQISQQQSAH